jgi:hypothetical protein
MAGSRCLPAESGNLFELPIFDRFVARKGRAARGRGCGMRDECDPRWQFASSSMSLEGPQKRADCEP